MRARRNMSAKKHTSARLLGRSARKANPKSLDEAGNAAQVHIKLIARAKRRNRVERFFNRIKQCRRGATRYDKLAATILPSFNSRQSVYGCAFTSPRPGINSIQKY